MAGHLGREPTAKWILKTFFWPGVFQDVRKYWVLECFSERRKEVTLIPITIIDEPFRWIAMDVVEPLPKTRKWNQYILVVCDYATRYPETFPIQTFTAAVVAEKLIKMFARYRIPEEILTDQILILPLNFCRSSTNCFESKQSRRVIPSTDRLISWTLQPDTEVNA